VKVIQVYIKHVTHQTPGWLGRILLVLKAVLSNIQTIKEYMCGNNFREHKYLFNSLESTFFCFRSLLVEFTFGIIKILPFFPIFFFKNIFHLTDDILVDKQQSKGSKNKHSKSLIPSENAFIY